MPGTLFIVATPIGNLEDISQRAVRILREVAVCAAEDTRHTARLLAHYGIATPMTSLHEHNERRKTPILLDRLRAGEDVAIVTDAGTPGVSDPGTGLIRAAAEAGIKVNVVPGASALTAALSGSGFPLERVLFAGFPPARTQARRRWFGEMTENRAVLVFFEAPHRLRDSLAEMAQVFGDREAVVAHELTKIHESWHRARLGDLANSPDLPRRGEFTILVNNLELPRVNTPSAGPEPAAIAAEFSQMTDNGGVSRREALGLLADRWQMTRRDVYAAVVQGKKSVKRQS